MVTNPQKGDVTFEAGNKSYTLRYSHLALVKLEKLLDKGLMKIMREIDTWRENPDDMRVGMVVALLWAGLQKHHPKITVDEAAELLDEMDGGAARAVEIIGESFQRAFSAPETKATNPPQKEVNGTGTVSSSSTSVMDTILPPSGSLSHER
jgi:hypothetical protein